MEILEVWDELFDFELSRVECMLMQDQISIQFNPIALRQAKIANNFGLSECNKVNILRCVGTLPGF